MLCYLFPLELISLTLTSEGQGEAALLKVRNLPNMLQLLPRWWQQARFITVAVIHLFKTKVFYSFKK